ncbi:DUF3027 domain-containing protein [Nocardia vinacea]|uniref:DUF3027 domain-containing protein n=1 Tax=Nocardia vinacea TaxID=96468 RepID=UPI002E167974
MSAVSVSQSGVRPILADAVDVARRALLELEPTGVGAHIGVTAEDESAATHRFEAALPGYRGWQWAVVVAAPPGAQYATVSESALLPGPDALVAPDFVPWEQRVRPGDLAPGDLLAPRTDDPRLVPGYVASGDPAVDEVALEIGLGRTKVLSREGREEAAERWYSEFGPETDMAKAAPSTCGRCGFYLPLAGALRSAFGVCGNAMGADGHVVHAEYGCGAHSDVEVPTGGGSPLYEAYDDAAFDVIPVEALRKPAAPDAVAGAESAPGTSDAATAAEPTTVEPSDRAASDTAAEPSDAAPGDATAESPSAVESTALPSDDVVVEPGAEAAVSQSESDLGVATGVAAASDAAGAAIHGASAIGAEGGVAGGESSVDEAVSESSGAAPASDVDRVAESVVDAAVETDAVVTEPGIEATEAQPESNAGAAGAAAAFVGEAEVPGDEASSVRGEAADAHAVSADADGGAVDAGTAGADGEVAGAGSASVDVAGGVARADSETAGADGTAVDSVGGDAELDGGVAHARSETTGVDDEGADVGGASADVDGGVARADSDTAGADRGAADSATADTDGGEIGTDGGASAVRGEVAGADGAVADDDGGHADADGGVAGTDGEAADSAGGSGPGAAARPEFGSSLQG